MSHPGPVGYRRHPAAHQDHHNRRRQGKAGGVQRAVEVLMAFVAVLGIVAFIGEGITIVLESGVRRVDLADRDHRRSCCRG